MNKQFEKWIKETYEDNDWGKGWKNDMRIAFEGGSKSIPLDKPVKPEIAKLKEILNTTMDMLVEAPELNMNNYNEAQVEELNNAVINAYNYLRDKQKQFSV